MRSRVSGSSAPNGSSSSISARLGGERARDADALLLAAGELVGPAVAHRRRVELDQLEQLVDAPRGCAPHPSRAARA